MKFKIKAFLLLALVCTSTIGHVSAQNTATLNNNATLNDLINFALNNKIEVKQAQIDQEIGEKEIASALSGWYPQISANGNYTHFMQLPTTNFNGQNIAMGQKNSSALTFQADQAIINPGLFQASKAAQFIREKNKLNSENVKINTIVNISKSYFDILTSEEQIKIINENISRLKRQFSDATARYETGLVDKIDFKRAQISLNNANAQLKSALEIRKYKYDYLKTLLGLNTNQNISLSFLNQDLEANILLDTAEIVEIANRVEIRQLRNVQNIQKLNTQYQKWSYLPKLNAFANYGLNYRNNSLGDLYGNNFPQSSIGLSLSIPIFQGFKRAQDIKKSQLQEDRIALDIENLENQIGAEYSAALALYKANTNEWKNSKENMNLSEEVYNTIKLQYDEGLKTYLELMTAETDLKTSQLNYLNALYAVLTSKIDIQKALGTINTTN